MIFLLQNIQWKYREKCKALLQLQKLINRPRFYYVRMWFLNVFSYNYLNVLFTYFHFC